MTLNDTFNDWVNDNSRPVQDDMASQQAALQEDLVALTQFKESPFYVRFKDWFDAQRKSIMDQMIRSGTAESTHKLSGGLAVLESLSSLVDGEPAIRAALESIKAERAADTEKGSDVL